MLVDIYYWRIKFWEVIPIYRYVLMGLLFLSVREKEQASTLATILEKHFLGQTLVSSVGCLVAQRVVQVYVAHTIDLRKSSQNCLIW